MRANAPSRAIDGLPRAICTTTTSSYSYSYSYSLTCASRAHIGANTGRGAAKPRCPRREAATQQLVQRDECPLEGPPYAGEQDAVEHAVDPGARRVLDHQPVDESLAVGLEVALMEGVRQALLRARVGDEPVRLEVLDPARAFLQADAPRPEARPV